MQIHICFSLKSLCLSFHYPVFLRDDLTSSFTNRGCRGRWNGLPSISEQSFSNGARAKTWVSWFSIHSFFSPGSSKLLVSLSKVHKSFCSWQGLQKSFPLFPLPRKSAAMLWSEGYIAGFGEYPVLIKTTRESTISGSTLKPQEIPGGQRLMGHQLLVLS